MQLAWKGAVILEGMTLGWLLIDEGKQRHVAGFIPRASPNVARGQGKTLFQVRDGTMSTIAAS